MKRLLTQQLVDAEKANRHKLPTKKRKRTKVKGEHPKDCLCRDCPNLEKEAALP